MTKQKKSKSRNLSFTLKELSMPEDKTRNSWTSGIKLKISTSLLFYIGAQYGTYSSTNPHTKTQLDK